MKREKFVVMNKEFQFIRIEHGWPGLTQYEEFAEEFATVSDALEYARDGMKICKKIVTYGEVSDTEIEKSIRAEALSKLTEREKQVLKLI